MMQDFFRQLCVGVRVELMASGLELWGFEFKAKASA